MCYVDSYSEACNHATSFSVSLLQPVFQSLSLSLRLSLSLSHSFLFIFTPSLSLVISVHISVSCLSPSLRIGFISLSSNFYSLPLEPFSLHVALIISLCFSATQRLSLALHKIKKKAGWTKMRESRESESGHNNFVLALKKGKNI